MKIGSKEFTLKSLFNTMAAASAIFSGVDIVTAQTAATRLAEDGPVLLRI